MPTIVTHVKPHIDDICAAWLLKRYLPVWREADISFVHTDELEDGVIDTPDRVHVGVGRGQFDEHKGNIGECAAGLVYHHINSTVVLNANERKALDKLVDWVREEDTGKFLADANRSFAIPSILDDQFFAKGRDSEEVYQLGSTILDALLIGMRNQVELSAIWTKRVEFDSVFGNAVALVGNAREAENMAYSKGFMVFVRQSDDSEYTEIKAQAKSDIDLTSLRDKLVKEDSKATWFFHHSKKMLICGGELTSKAKPSNFTVNQIIELMK